MLPTDSTVYTDLNRLGKLNPALNKFVFTFLYNFRKTSADTQNNFGQIAIFLKMLIWKIQENFEQIQKYHNYLKNRPFGEF